MLLGWVAVAAFAAAGEVCQPPPAEQVLSLGPADLAARERALRERIVAASAACRPALDLELGEVLVGLGDAPLALAPLIRVVAVSPALRARALTALGRAQALSGQPFEALRSLAMAERLAGDARAAWWDRGRQATTLLARLYLRRGGSLKGLYRYDSGYARVLRGELKRTRALAAGGGALLALGRDGAVSIGDQPLPALPALAGRPRALAAASNGAVVLLGEGGVLVRSGGLGVTLAVPGNRGKSGGIAGDNLALSPNGDFHVLAKGEVHRFDGDGRFIDTIDATRDVIALAADGRQRLYLLREDRGGLLVVDRAGRVVQTIAASGEGWMWSSAQALAVDELGGTYVLSRSANAIFLFDPEGVFCGRIDPPADDPRLLRSAQALAVDLSGSLYLLLGKDDTVVRYR